MTRHYSPHFLAPLMVALLLSLHGCSNIKHFNPLYQANPLAYIEIVSQLDANYGYAVEVDLVFIEQDYLAEAIGQLSAMAWFGDKKQGYQIECPGPVCVKHLEIMPGDPVPPLQLPAGHKLASKVFVFAWYLKDDRAHREDISQFDKAKIILKHSSFTVEKIQ